TLLPLPDSPTMATVSLGLTVSETSRIAACHCPCILNSVLRFLSSSMGLLLFITTTPSAIWGQLHHAWHHPVSSTLIPLAKWPNQGIRPTTMHREYFRNPL